MEFDAISFVPNSDSTSQHVSETVISLEVPTVDVPDTVDHETVEEEEDAIVEETPSKEVYCNEDPKKECP